MTIDAASFSSLLGPAVPHLLPPDAPPRRHRCPDCALTFSHAQGLAEHLVIDHWWDEPPGH